MTARSELERYLILARELKRRNPWSELPGPQTLAYNSLADIIGYGGSAGGGKTDLICGSSIKKHKRVLVLRREKAQTEGVVQRLTEILGDSTGYNSQKSIWRINNKTIVEFGGLDNIGDESRWQGRAHDLKAFDEVTEMRESQVRFVMGWTRTNDPSIHPKVLMTFNPPTTAEGRWVIDFFGPWLDKKHALYPAQPGQLIYAAMLPNKNGGSSDVWLDRSDKFVLADGKPCYEFNPKDYKPEQIITPKSRTFIPARVTDNPYYMSTGYMSTLQSLPEPLRSQMLYGDFQAGIEDDVWQLIPTKWVDIAMARWKVPDQKPPMDSMGVDVARGGKDKTVISRRHGMWFDEQLRYPGSETPDGPAVAGLTISAVRDGAPIHIDVIGVGSSPYDYLRDLGQHVISVNVAEKAFGTDKSGALRFLNLRSELYWRAREAFDPANNTGIAIPPDEMLKKDLCAPRWKTQGPLIRVESREEIVERIQRSPDDGSAFIMALINTPKMAVLNHLANTRRRDYDPYAIKR